jgi:hypothetical protein
MTAHAENSKSVIFWGERGLVSTLFVDLYSAPGTLPWERLLASCNFPGSSWQGEKIRAVIAIVEPDFSNTGFGHPDAILKVVFESGSSIVLVVEAKRLPYRSCCADPSNRGGAGFNSTLNGQLELNHCLTLALEQYKTSEAVLIEPAWICHTPYNLERRGSLRCLKNRVVIEQVGAPFAGLPFRAYFHLAITPDSNDPFEAKENEAIWPVLYHPEFPFQNCWRNLRPQFGWISWDAVKETIRSLEAEGKLGFPSLFLGTYESNLRNFKFSGMPFVSTPVEGQSSPDDIQESNDSGVVFWSPTPIRSAADGKGVRMIYAPDINPRTFLHFSWQHESCALRDYSKSPTLMPVEVRSWQTAEVRKRLTKEIPIRNRRPISDVEYWHKTTMHLNASEQPPGA